MNAIVDMINDGLICKYCEEWIDGEAPGHRRVCYCEDCQNKASLEKEKRTKKKLFGNIKK